MRTKEVTLMILAYCMSLIIIGVSNHCIFEDLFGVSPSEHTHHESSGSHKHGQAHSLLLLNSQKGSLDFLTYALLITPLTFIIIFILRFKFLSRLQIGLLSFERAKPPGTLRESISSLISAPQAPPYFI